MVGLSPSHARRRPCVVMSGVLDTNRLADPDLAGFESLLGPSVPTPLAAAFAEAGSRVVKAEPVQVQWSPGRRAMFRYKVRAEGGALSGHRQVVAVAGPIPEGALVLEGPEGPIGVWVVPNDPLLPGLVSALHKPAIAQLLSDLGLADAVRSLQLRSYRPGRRAVVEASTSGVSLYLKVLPPSKAEALHVRHRLLGEHLPVPDSLGFSRDLGVVVMPSLPGVDLRTALQNHRADLPSPGAIASLLGSLPLPPDGWEATSPLEHLPSTLRLLRRLVPQEIDRLEALGSSIGGETSSRSVPSHGDYHEAQLMTKDGALVGLLDVDTYGLGRPGDDPATMLGHLTLLARSAPDSSRVLQLALSLNRIWDTVVDPIDLRKRTAAMILGMAVGPFRVQRPNWRQAVVERIRVAETWAESVSRLDERSLTLLSGGSHEHVGALKL